MTDGASETDPAALAREAMQRAQQAARIRGAVRQSPGRARASRKQRREATQPFQTGRDPLAMSAAVDQVLKRMGWQDQIDVASVTARWREIAGDSIADHATVVEFDDGTLTLQASSTAWATQLSLMEGQIIHTVNEHVGSDVVKHITVVGPAARAWKRGPRSVPGRGPRDTYG